MTLLIFGLLIGLLAGILLSILLAVRVPSLWSKWTTKAAAELKKPVP